MRKWWQPNRSNLTFIGAVGVGTVLHYTTPTPIPFVIIGLLIAYFGGAILERLAHLPAQSGLHTEIPAFFETFQIDSLLEKKFKVWFVDGEWEAGWAFGLYGSVLGEPTETGEGPVFGNRTGINIYSMSNGFQKAEIGQIRSLNKGASCYIGLPVEMARHVLEDARQDIRQVATIGFSRVTDSDGKVSYPIYSFELEKSLD